RVLSLADLLRKRGIEAGALVGVWVPRSIDLVVALLAVHAAGAAFLPLDPNDPEQRVEHLLGDSKPAVVLVANRTTGRLGHTGVESIDLDDPSIRAHRAEAAEPRFPDPAATAYVIYTSGSTGQPKGVRISQASLANHVAAITEQFELEAADRVLQ